MSYFFRVPGRFPTDDNPDACVLVIRRDAILPDALIGLTNHSDENLKKPLMVHTLHSVDIYMYMCNYNCTCTCI